MYGEREKLLIIIYWSRVWKIFIYRGYATTRIIRVLIVGDCISNLLYRFLLVYSYDA